MSTKTKAPVVPKAPVNTFTQVEYQGHNAVTLSGAGYSENEWATYKQWFEHGWQVQKGEHGHPIMVVRDNPENDKKVVKYYRVFNVAQVKPIEEEQ